MDVCGVQEHSEAMKVTGFIHGSIIHPTRLRNLVAALGPLLQEGATLLDVGCGDGRLASMLREKRQLRTVEGVDVLVRSEVAIPVRAFDGRHLPWNDGAWDYVMAVDVFHHAEDPRAILGDMLRVARQGVLIKDHLSENWGDDWILRKMDAVGNDRHGVAVPGNYLSMKEWSCLFDEVNARVVFSTNRVPIYFRPLSWVFGRGLHCIFKLEKT